jgi:hypothetical protein
LVRPLVTQDDGTPHERVKQKRHGSTGKKKAVLSYPDTGNTNPAPETGNAEPVSETIPQGETGNAGPTPEAILTCPDPLPVGTGMHILPPRLVMLSLSQKRYPKDLLGRGRLVMLGLPQKRYSQVLILYLLGRGSTSCPSGWK